MYQIIIIIIARRSLIGSSRTEHITCRFDIGLSPAAGTASFDVCLLKDNGEFVAAMNGPLECVQDPLMAEARACKEVLSWINEKPRRMLDCLNLFYALNPNVSDLSYTGSITHVCVSLISSFSSYLFRHISRSTNQLAHTLTKAVGSQSLRDYS